MRSCCLTSYHYDPIGLNLDVVGPLTVATLLRWMNMVRRMGVLDIKRVHLERFGPFQYDPMPLDTVPESELLAPGDYGCFHRGDCLRTTRCVSLADTCVPERRHSAVFVAFLTVYIGSTLADMKSTWEWRKNSMQSEGAARRLEMVSILSML